MADYDLTYSNASRVAQASAVAQGSSPKTLFKDFDARKQNLAATDTVQLVGLPNNAVMIGYNVQVLRAEGSAATLNVGITGAATEIASALDVNAIGNASAVPTTNPIGTDINILLTVPAATTIANALIRVSYTFESYPVGLDEDRYA